VNIEIADYFNTSGTVALTFSFQENFARDMSYSIAWALFALLLLVRWHAQARCASALRESRLARRHHRKTFLSRLSQLDQLYRISAFVVVAIIAMVASFLYQRFLGAAEKINETKSRSHRRHRAYGPHRINGILLLRHHRYRLA